MIMKTPDGRYLQQTVGMGRMDGKLYYNDLSVTEMPSGFDYENSLLYLLPTNTDTYLVLAQGADLYYYNWSSPEDGIKPYWHFDAPVKAMAMSTKNPNFPQLGCALENGQFVILNVKMMKNRPENQRLYWQTPSDVNLGNAVSMIYKTSGQL